MSTLLTWVVFNAFVLALLALDLGVFNRRPHVVGTREAAAWSVFWIVLSLAFNVGVYFQRGPDDAVDFFTCYLLEKSLSADNLFLFAVIFGTMGVLAEYQHRVLFWGVLGAIVLRGTFIIAGVQLVQHFHWVLYVFAGFLLFTGVRLLFGEERKYDPAQSAAFRLVRKYLPFSDQYAGGRMFVKSRGRILATPLFLVLVLIELADIAFAVDSIPAIFAVTQDAFIVYSSNIFAILGLRSLYFLLARGIVRFRFLPKGLAIILVLVGVKMLAGHWVHVPTTLALGAIVIVLVVTIWASLLAERAGKNTHERPQHK